MTEKSLETSINSDKNAMLEVQDTNIAKLCVALRIRPLTNRELTNQSKTIVQVLDNQSIQFELKEYEHPQGVKTLSDTKNQIFQFDNVFHTKCTNREIFNDLILKNIKPLFDGNNLSIFVYGATGTGKTYTMFGRPKSPGIVYLTIKEIFKQIESTHNELKYRIYVSYLEIYNDDIYDLLNLSRPLKLRENSKNVLFVSGLRHVTIKTASELINVIKHGNCNRTQYPTESNNESSRSHAMVQVYIKMTDRYNQTRFAKLSITDLAGSERVSSSANSGSRFKEALNINRNLLALGNCINLLADGSNFIPYRDSQLTRLLKDTLGGNCRTVMIANIAPTSNHYYDTFNTLKYSARAKKIKRRVIDIKKEENMFQCIKRINKINATLKEIEKHVQEFQESTGSTIKPGAIILPLIRAVLSQKSYVTSHL